MLQQTQVARVVEPFERFLGRFPTAAACADAPTAEVLRAWEGLGYHRRAVFLHRAATVIVQRYGGHVPSERAQLETLPGVGPYTARAVRAFAFELDTGVVDTNVVRVLTRAVAGRPIGPSEAQALADRLVPRGRAWAFNQALFDLGTAHCTARHRRCETCPLRRRCVWARAGWPAPDPSWGRSGAPRRPVPFAGSDRQGRGRLVAALRRGAVGPSELAIAAGWPDDPARAMRTCRRLVADGVARFEPDGGLSLA
jgi:A/G-specific adenine glycosylase